MKPIINVFAVLLLVPFLMVFSNEAHAQDDASDIYLGGGLSYGEGFDELGLQLGGYYNYNEDIRFGGDFTYWLIDSPQESSSTYLELNGNAHYLFYQENDITLYGIGSLGLHYASWESNFNGSTFSSSDTELGLGIGGGIEYDLGQVKLYGEPRFFLTGFDQFTLSFGARFGI